MENKERFETTSTILDKMCASTFTRHADLSTEDFLKVIGRENDESESVAVREARLNLLIACTKEVLSLKCMIENLLKMMNKMQGDE